MHGCHLTIDDREVIAELIAARRSQAAVAERLGCSPSTISRELSPYGSYDRNRSPDGSYRPSRAQAAQRHRRTSKRPWKLETTAEALAEVAEDEEAGEHISEDRLSETVTDKGYHSNRTMADQRGHGVRTYCSEPHRGKRSWKGKQAQRDAVYANRRRIGGRRGKRLLRRRAEVVERGFAHCYETGGMRRTHLRGRGNILKRQLIHVAGFNLSLLMRRVLGVGTPRALAGALAAVRRVFLGLLRRLRGLEALLNAFSGRWKPNRLKSRTRAAA